MWTRLRNVWHPENFHYAHRLARRRNGHFEGWYLKLVDARGEAPLAVIPGVFLGDDAHAFVQVLDGDAGTARYHRFPLEAFRASRDRFAIEIDGNRFGTEGLRLALPELSGSVRFGPWTPWPVRWNAPGVMGPYGFVPFMECNHGILSFDHELDGELVHGTRRCVYDGGRGYVEKDWGRRFPAGYVWTQSNHFGAPGVSLSASVAVIPWLTGAFRGFLVGFLHDGRLHRFTTWTGARIERLAADETHLRMALRNRTHRLELDARKEPGAVLHAPYDHAMIERVAETMRSEVTVRLATLDEDRVVYEGRGRHACLEMQGDLDAVLDR